MTELILSDELKKQLKELFLVPVHDLFSKGIIRNPNAYEQGSSGSIAIKTEHRKTLIDFGRGDFQTSTDEITAEQKVILYCYYYFQMHFSSSYVFYRQEKDFLLESINRKKVLFIDIGCGPFTAGLAFHRLLDNFTGQYTADIDYIGIDTSKEMLRKAGKVFESILHPVYTNATFTEDRNEAFNTSRFIKEKDKEVLVILNFCFLFGSESITAPSMADYTNKLIETYSNLQHQKTKFIVLQQNPDYPFLNKKWGQYKSLLPKLVSKTGYPQSIDFCFDDLFGNHHSPTFTHYLKCDILKSMERR